MVWMTRPFCTRPGGISHNSFTPVEYTCALRPTVRPSWVSSTLAMVPRGPSHSTVAFARQSAPG